MYKLSNHVLEVLLQFSYGDKQPIMSMSETSVQVLIKHVNSLEFHYIIEYSNQLLMNRTYQTDT